MLLAKRLVLLLTLTTLGLIPVWPQTLQLHFMDVGQGDGAVLISPGGEVVLFDDGVEHKCGKPLNYLQHLGLDHVDYHITSHYHNDHIGCIKEVLAEYPLTKAAYDRGGSYHTDLFDDYVTAVGSLRQTATAGQKIKLDATAQHPVTIEIVALNGNGVVTSNENDLSLVAVIHYRNFDAVMGGDLSGFKALDYKDIETSVAPKVGHVEVYKVNHHCSAYSTNADWLGAIQPIIGIVSVGKKNTHEHPTQECLERLHQAGVKTYWTEVGGGAQPEPDSDFVSGNVVVTTDGVAAFTVDTDDAGSHTYPIWGSSTPAPTDTFLYAWSVDSTRYHYAQCRYVRQISPANLQQGSTPAQGKALHSGCPQ